MQGQQLERIEDRWGWIRITNLEGSDASLSPRSEGSRGTTTPREARNENPTPWLESYDSFIVSYTKMAILGPG